jgi:putative ABC transport system permease protein
MIDFDKWREIWATLTANKLRTFLTAFGVFWGLLMLMLMLMFTTAMRTGTKRQMGGISSNALFLWGDTTTVAYQGMQPGRRIQFRLGDLEPLQQVNGLETVSPRIQMGGFMTPSKATYGGKSGSFQIMGDYPQLLKVINMTLPIGRFINERDIEESRKVCVLGNGVVEQLYPPKADPIGTWIQINGIFFRVVGMTKSTRSGGMGDRDANSIYVPYSAFRQAFNTGDRIGFFAMTAKPGVPGPVLEDDIRKVLNQRHRISPDDKLAVGTFNAFVFFGKMEGLFFSLDFVMWIAGVATLLAGVLGVANIMLITVKERTKELGVRKALGASPLSIVVMVMKESLVLTSIAGLAGIVTGIGVMALASKGLEMAGPSTPFGPPAVGFTTVLAALAILVVSGGLAGIMPAIHAASIKPVEALRAE